MTNDRTTGPATIRPLDAVLIAIASATIAGGAWLLSAPETTKLMEGAVPWHEESVLRAVAQLLCLGYAFPTLSPGTVKVYLLGLGAGLAVLAIAVAAVVRARGAVETIAGVATNEAEDDASRSPVALPHKSHVAPLAAAQLLIGLYLLWSFASGRWSSAPALSVGGTILLSVQFLWAFGLGIGLSIRAAVIVTRIIVGVTGITALLAVWYVFGRNPGLRAMFPFGNPIFLATCLVPGILLSLTWLFERALRTGVRWNLRQLLTIGAILLVHGMAGLAFSLADSRGPALGLLFGILAMAFFLLRGRWRLAPIVVAVLVTLAGWAFFSHTANNYSRTGRSATIRLRQYAWDYAWRMFLERPFTGQGQGAFVLKGDSYAVDDVLADPQVFEHRIDHAHNEWLEVLADLGAVGFVLLVGGLLITLRAATLAVDRRPVPAARWALIGIGSSLVALVVTETFSVGLRVSGVPTFFFSALGLTWALSNTSPVAVTERLGATSARRVLCGVVGMPLAIAVLLVTQADWSSAREEFLAGVAFEQGRSDEAVEHAARAVTRLNPQRALRGLARLTEAHLRSAAKLQQRAAERERRAFETEPVNLRLALLAREDFELSDRYCVEGTHALKELVSRSPGFIRSGLLEYKLSVSRAQNADAYARLAGDLPGHALTDEQRDALYGARDQFIKNAVRALERELLRQPFNPTIAIEYARFGAGGVDFAARVNALARPLRQHRITQEYVDVMGVLLSDPRNEPAMDALVDQARQALTLAVPLDPSGNPIELWAPERMRLDAMVRFLRGDYAGATTSLKTALAGYEPIADAAPIATASCYAELADATFFADPLHPDEAIALAQTATDRAPAGSRGRALTDGILRRLVDYHLAGDRENDAVALLARTAPPGATEAAAHAELANRYRRLCESMLLRRPDRAPVSPPAALRLVGPPAPEPVSYIAPELLSALRRWIARAAALEPKSADVWRVAAAIELECGDPAGAIDRIKKGIDTGLPSDVVTAFIKAASTRFAGDPALENFAALRASEPTATPRSP